MPGSLEYKRSDPNKKGRGDGYYYHRGNGYYSKYSQERDAAKKGTKLSRMKYKKVQAHKRDTKKIKRGRI